MCRILAGARAFRILKAVLVLAVRVAIEVIVEAIRALAYRRAFGVNLV